MLLEGVGQIAHGVGPRFAACFARGWDKSTGAGRLRSRSRPTEHARTVPFRHPVHWGQDCRRLQRFLDTRAAADDEIDRIAPDFIGEHTLVGVAKEDQVRTLAYFDGASVHEPEGPPPH